MKVTLSWLRQYVEFDWSPGQLAERLTMLGLEVESVQTIAGEFEGVVVAQILTRDKVPGADKLSVCKVNDGRGERTIICGAQNHQPGDKVPLILPNHALPLKPGEKEPFVIKERKVFGITSQGMMCSPRELGLSDDAEGLLILPKDAKVGQPFAEHLGRSGGDVVFDLEVTPNRPDLNSVIGIAREIAAVSGAELRIPEIRIPKSEVRAESLVSVRIESPDLCPRYTARVVKGVKIGPSPEWLRKTLERVGIRSINNVVDVTNYVMLECGQPLHSFDHGLIAKSADGWPVILIRRAQDGELFVTLDGQKRTLTKDMLLIADERKGIALAGIMGGQNTEINDATRDVLLESAYFSPTNIRRTSKALGLRSESSYRFERGADIGIADWASRRAAQLILQTAGGELADGLVDAYPTPAEPTRITLRYAKTDQLLGVAIPPVVQLRLLESVGLRRADGEAPTRVPFVEASVDTVSLLNKQVIATGAQPGATVIVPTWRVDLKRETDLIEEIERLHGLEKIPATPPRGAIGSNSFDAVHDQIAEVRRILCGLGLNEAQGQTLISKADCHNPKVEELVMLANPLSSDMDVLRPSLLPGLIHSLRHNVTRKHYDVALFEIGRVFHRSSRADLPARGSKVKADPVDKAVCPLREERRLAIALTGQRYPVFWSGEEREAKFDLYDLKGMIEEVLEQFGVRGVSYARRTESSEIFLESASIQLGKHPLGELGQLSPILARKMDLRDAVLLAELNLDLLLARRGASRPFKPLPPFPGIRRDVAMLVPESTTHETVMQTVRTAKPANLESVELFDVFRGKNVPGGQKSLAYAFTYRSAEKTLTDAEVNAEHERMMEEFKQKLSAVIR
jgi:phenylalanyl-tRNA synthetase beta chain